MKKHATFAFTAIALILGLMLAIQFQTTAEPKVRDTRDIWELREDLEKEKKQQIGLNEQISQYQQLLNQYKNNSEKENIIAMEEALYDLQEEAGLTEKAGEGIVLTIEPLFEEELLGKKVPVLTPELLMRLVNQLNTYEIDSMAINDQRVIATSAIREVNGKTYVNNRPLPELPVKLYVIANEAERLFDRMKASDIVDDFAQVNLLLSSVYKEEVEVPAYERHLSVKYMEPVKEES